MTALSQQMIPAIFAAAVLTSDITSAFAQGSDSLQGFEACKIIPVDRDRLNCLKKLLPDSASRAAPPEEDAAAWRLIRTPRPNGGADAVAIMRTADTTQSDPDLAGLMIRCQEKPGLEVLLALVRPLPPRGKRDVVVNLGATTSVLRAQASPIGTALVMPIEATDFTTGPFRELHQFSIKINDPESDIKGVIPLDGIGHAIARLSASCPSR